ncbi:uncharacterized protein LOC131666911 [Phymastichus coffea]|uniref:uncharacterized protein LOC131666911 n=1 Tax=Phymastichus coffea TaxID=108790 RepID=UPI00273C9EEC|nr:uncharacterized protein LOC131666911 [Phymastichus coffea]
MKPLKSKQKIKKGKQSEEDADSDVEEKSKKGEEDNTIYLKKNENPKRKKKNEVKAKVLDSESEENSDDESILSNKPKNKTKVKLKDKPVKEVNQRGELEDAIDTVDRINNDLDKFTGLAKTLTEKEMKAREIEEAGKEIKTTMLPLNEWTDTSILGNVQPFKIVNKIPHILTMVRTSSVTDDPTLIESLLSGKETNELITKSCDMFKSGTSCVKYVIDSLDTFAPLRYDPEGFNETSLQLKHFSVTGDGDASINDAEARTKAYCALLELILKLRSQGNVIIQSPTVTTIANFGVLNGPINLLAGKNVPTGMMPHLLLGVYAYTAMWFRNEVTNLISEDDVVIGEYDSIVQPAGTNAKKRSNYGVITDHVFASLNRVMINQHDSKRANAFDYVQNLKYLLLYKCSIELVGEAEADIWDIYNPNNDDAQKYIFVFLLSPRVRQYQYQYLSKFLHKMKGIREISAADRLMNERQSPEVVGIRSILEESLNRKVRGYSLGHWYQAMVMERAHAFISPSAYPKVEYTTIQDAIFDLLAFALDALTFPNTFWSNLHIYGYVLYKAWQYIRPREF